MNAQLSGKTVLFFGPETFNYENEIVRELKRMGALVYFRSDKPGKTFLVKALLRLVPRLLWRYSDKVFTAWLEASGPSDCDIVFVVKGEGLSPSFIDLLRAKYPRAQFVLYLWDSLKNVRQVGMKLPKFDRIYSFDPLDCRNNAKFKYRPLFFLPAYRERVPQLGSGCFFIGTLNGDRPTVISLLLRACPKDVEIDYWLFVRSGVELFVRKVIDRPLTQLASARMLRRPMTSASIGKHFQAAAAIIDIEHPNQRGLTMRTFEVLASGKKLITTNQNVANHDFYDPARICIIDRVNPKLSAGFLNSPMTPLPPEFFEKYALHGWITEILHCATCPDLDSQT